MSIPIFLVKLCVHELSFPRWASKSLSICLAFSCYLSSFTDSFTLIIKGQESHFSAKPLQTQTKRNKRQNKALEKEKRILYISKVWGDSCVVVQRNMHIGNAAILGEEASKVFDSRGEQSRHSQRENDRQRSDSQWPLPNPSRSTEGIQRRGGSRSRPPIRRNGSSRGQQSRHSQRESDRPRSSSRSPLPPPLTVDWGNKRGITVKLVFPPQIPSSPQSRSALFAIPAAEQSDKGEELAIQSRSRS